MADKLSEPKKSSKKTIRSPVFLQFVLILLVVISLILFTSASFYRSMIENVTAISLRNSLDDVETIDFKSSDNYDVKLHDVELNRSVIVEVFEKSGDEYKPLYRQMSSTMYNDGNEKITEDVPLINFDYQRFKEDIASENGSMAEYDETSYTGNYENTTTGYSFYILVSEPADSSMLYVIGMRSTVISAQADAISIAIVFILLITFILVALTGYLFITRVTKPMRDIRDYTKAMADSNDVTLRIPEREYFIRTETDETIACVNYLYEKLILTQENLREKSDFLASQIEERDIEQKAREEFIASTSHELKTPISIIQGYAEGAKYLKDDHEALDEYCDTIIDECVRMTNLVVNMMSLSDIQRTKIVHFKEFSVRDFIDDRIRLLTKTFEKYNITLQNQITDDIYGRGEPEKLHFVINNLISNAISYMGGERILRLRYEDLGTVYRIFVFNSGKSIPQAELEKLWESFYRQDPARNRNEGHFGLGLSIVKSVQDAHSMSCGVDNAEGGVEFWFDILK